MKTTLNSRLLAAFGVLMALIAAVGVAAVMQAWKSRSDYRELYGSTRAAAALGEANHVLWELRYATAQASSATPEAARKIADAEAGRYKKVWAALDAYAATQLATDEQAALAKTREVFKRYTEVRPKWFELHLAGQADEAKAWRSQQMTPVGAELVQAVEQQIRLQASAADATSAALGRQASWMGWGVLVVAVLALLGAAALSRWIVRMLTGPLSRSTQLARSIAQGDLRARIDVEPGPLSALQDALRDMQASLARTVAQVRDNAQEVAAAGNHIAQGNSDMSSRTEQQASSLQQTAASMEELSSTVRQNAENAREANQLAQVASDVATRGGDVVAQVVGTMKGINDSSKEIAEIIGVIDGIAFQTNILALNAAVEAARAGEQGRGFAVVAAEVRSLAQRSAEAAKAIKTLISASVERVDQGTTLVDQAGATMQEVVQSIRSVSTLVAEISTASAQQSAGVAQVSEAVADMDRNTQQNAALMHVANESARSLQERADRLVGAVSVFKT
jgi:methyl-accepting chemotaxis protein